MDDFPFTVGPEAAPDHIALGEFRCDRCGFEAGCNSTGIFATITYQCHCGETWEVLPR